MRYLVLATDYDGTIAHDGVVDAATIQAIERFRASGGRPLLVTGRELPDLDRTFARFDLFDRIVAENGGVLYNPATKRERVLCAPSSPALVDALRARGVPLSVGRAIVATVEPHQQAVLDAIRELGLELQVIFNKGAVMVLPSGVNKATGLLAALEDLCVSPHDVVGVGDAENDHAFLEICELSVAVRNAVPALRRPGRSADAGCAWRRRAGADRAAARGRSGCGAVTATALAGHWRRRRIERSRSTRTVPAFSSAGHRLPAT